MTDQRQGGQSLSPRRRKKVWSPNVSRTGPDTKPAWYLLGVCEVLTISIFEQFTHQDPTVVRGLLLAIMVVYQTGIWSTQWMITLLLICLLYWGCYTKKIIVQMVYLKERHKQHPTEKIRGLNGQWLSATKMDNDSECPKFQFKGNVKAHISIQDNSLLPTLWQCLE